MKRTALLLALILGACQNGTTKPTNDVLAAMTGYQAALTIAVAYNKLPPCVNGGPTICRDAGVVAQMRKADDAALAALKSAETVSLTPGVTSSATTAALAAASQSVAAFQAIVAIYKPKVS